MNICMKYIIGIPIIMIFLFSCEGPTGPMGPQGDKGVAGNDGTDGIDGLDGVANIQVINISINLSDIEGNDNSRAVEINVPEITSEVMTGGVVIVYRYIEESVTTGSWWALPFLFDTYSIKADNSISYFSIQNNFGYIEGALTIFWLTTEDETITFDGFKPLLYKIVIIPPN